LLAALAPSDLALLRAHFTSVTLDRRHPLEYPNKKVEHIYFMEHGIASVVAAGDSGREIEVGLIGCEGVTGLAVILGDDRSPHSTYMQVGGSGQKISVQAFRDAMESSAELRAILLHYTQAFMVQTSHTAVANARGSVEERLARWMLMAHDRVDGDDIALTHEFMAVMLGTRRPGVTEAVQALSRKGLIRTERGLVVIADREGLLKRAGKLYGVPEAEYDRLIGATQATRSAARASLFDERHS
jgi:CRP-like cAMP-binding protein